MTSAVLHISEPRELLRIREVDFDGRITAVEFDHILRLSGGLWLHSGDSSAPHAELTSGMCSDGFVNTLALLKYANLCMLLGREMARIYREECIDRPDWVIGSDHAGATISFATAYHLGVKHEFTEKGPEGKTQLWKRETIGQDELALQVEELVTTTTTLEKVWQGVKSGNAMSVSFADVVMTLVHRSASYEFRGRKILYFRHYDIQTWKPEDCPLCAAGSRRLRPKQHWAELKAG